MAAKIAGHNKGGKSGAGGSSGRGRGGGGGGGMAMDSDGWSRVKRWGHVEC